jgi:ketosteroid isomerase-like protein
MSTNRAEMIDRNNLRLRMMSPRIETPAMLLRQADLTRLLYRKIAHRAESLDPQEGGSLHRSPTVQACARAWRGQPIPLRAILRGTMSEESTTPDLAARWQEGADAYARRDLHTAMRHLAPDAVWDFSSAGFGSFEGAAAIRSVHEDWLGAYEEYEYNQEEALDLGSGVLFVVASIGGRLAGSAGRVQEQWGFTVTWAGGMIVRVVVSQDIEKARAAAERLAASRG